LTTVGEYVIDGNAVNKLLDTYQLEMRMLPGQVFDIIEKRLIKGLADEIDKAKSQAVRFVDLEAVFSGPYKDFAYAICGGLAELVDSLVMKKISVNGILHDPESLPWNLASRIDKNFKGTAQAHTG